MDVRHFLEQRLLFVSQLYANSVTSFVEKKRMIEAKEYPYVPPYSEDGEPPFLIEWIEAEESLQVLGHACVSMLSASFHLYFKATERRLRVLAGSKYKSAFKSGWFHGYKAYFLGEFNVVFENSQCNLDLLEELVLVRNRVQHPESITTHRTDYSRDDLKKLHSPIFMDPRDIDLFSGQEVGERNWLVSPTIQVTPEKFQSAVLEIRRFTDWLENRTS